MKDFEKSLSSFDKKIDSRLKGFRFFFNRYFSIVSTLFFIILASLFFIRFFTTRPRIIAAMIEEDIRLITLALDKIDAKCNILAFEGDYNDVDFLNVKSFSGSQVGSMGLAYPQKWEGPYFRINPTVQDKYYEIVCAADGWFVLPGRGVLLPNGLVIGKDFEIKKKTKVARLLREGGPLCYEDKKFAKKLMFKIGDWDSWHFKEETVKKIDRMLKEFHEAMPFTQNTDPQSRFYV